MGPVVIDGACVLAFMERSSEKRIGLKSIAQAVDNEKIPHEKEKKCYTK